MKTGHIKEALVLAFGPPPIFGLGNAGGFEFHIRRPEPVVRHEAA